jgi:co-chaperonin GroES (HSP10)
MIKESNKELVVIEPVKEKEAHDSGILKSDVEMQNNMKKQNRGTVVMVGSKCDWAQKGDFVSFYRNAATSITEGGKEYLVVHEGHILVKIKEDE